MRKWILGFSPAFFNAINTFNAFSIRSVLSALFVFFTFAPNALYAQVLPKALDSRETIFVDGFYFYGGERASVNCRVDAPQVSEEELREAGIPKDAPLFYMGEEVCDELKQSYLLANDTIADKYNDRDKRAILPNQVLNIIDSKENICDDKPCIHRALGRFNLGDRNEFAAIELLNNDKPNNDRVENDAKSSKNADKKATSHTLGIIYKIFGYAGWREAKSDNETKKVPLPLSAFESYEESEDSESPKEAQQGGYGGFLARESMLVNTRSAINQYSGTPNFRPILLPSAYLGLYFPKNITLFATPEAVLKSTQNNAKSSANNAEQNATTPNPKDIILDSIYYTAKRAILGREALAKQGIHLSAPLLDKVFVLGLGSGKFEKIAQVLVIRGDSLYFWGYIALQDLLMRKEILHFYADMSEFDEAKKDYGFIPRERMPRQISLNDLREIVKVEYPAKIKAVVAFDTQSVEYRRKPYIDEKVADSLPPREKPSMDSSGFAAYYQLPISGSLNRQLDKASIKKALGKAKKQGERELEIELVAEIKKGLLPQNMLLNAGDSEVADKKSPIMFRLVSEKDLAQEKSEDSENKEELLCIGDELLKRGSVPMYNEKWQLVGFLDKVGFRSENATIEMILGLNNTGRGDYYVVNVRNAQGDALSRFVRVAKSALMPCEKYDIAKSPDYAKAADIRDRLAQIKRVQMAEGEWVLKKGETAVGNAKSVKSLKEAIQVAMSWDSDAKALNKLDLKHGDSRVEYDRGKGHYPQKISVDFVFVGFYENFISMVESATLQTQDKQSKSSKDSNVFKQQILVLLPRVALILSETEVVYIHLGKMDF